MVQYVSQNTRAAGENADRRGPQRRSIVVRGAGVPFAEDTWSKIRIGSVPFDVVKASARCVITTTDQNTTARGDEPLATLATYRRVPRGVLFGQNLVHAAEGVVSVGDTLELGY